MIIIKYSEFNIVSDKIRMYLYGVKMKTQKNSEIRVLNQKSWLLMFRNNYVKVGLILSKPFAEKAECAT